MWRGPHFIGGLQNSPWRSQSPSPSPSLESVVLFKNWQNSRKLFFLNWKCKKQILEKKHMSNQTYNQPHLKKKLISKNIFLYFLWFFMFLGWFGTSFVLVHFLIRGLVFLFSALKNPKFRFLMILGKIKSG